MPLISVVMPVYNVEKYIAASVESVCKQSFSDFEIILVDDGSTDSSVTQAKTVLKEKAVAYTIISQANAGVASARNAGIKAAKGEWVICVDSDDCIHPLTLEIISRYTADSANDVIAFDFQRTDSQPECFPPLDVESTACCYNKKELAEGFFLRRLELIAPSLLIRRSMFSEGRLSYNEGCCFSEDQLFIWSLIMNTDRLCFVQSKLYYYLSRQNSIMTSSGVEKIMTGYHAFAGLETKLKDSAVQLGVDTGCIFPRWIIGALHSSSKQMSYADFLLLADEFEYKRFMRRLYGYPDKRISLLALVLMLNKRLFYRISAIV